MTAQPGPRKIALASTRPGWMQGLVASLPRSLSRCDDPAGADLVLVDGQGVWPERICATIAAGARRIALIEPGPVDATTLDRAMTAIDGAYAECFVFEDIPDSPALEGFRAMLEQGFAEFVVTGSHPESIEQLVLAQIRLLRALQVGEVTFPAPALSSRAILADGRAKVAGAEVRLRLSGALAPGDARMEIVAHSGEATARLAWEGGTEARPITVGIANVAGLTILPALHEGGIRTALRALLSGSSSGKPESGLRHFADDLALAGMITRTP